MKILPNEFYININNQLNQNNKVNKYKLICKKDNRHYFKKFLFLFLRDDYELICKKNNHC